MQGTLNDGWLTEQLLGLVEKIGESLGFRFVMHDVGGCAGGKASCYLEKNGVYHEIEVERFDHKDIHLLQTIQKWIEGLTSY